MKSQVQKSVLPSTLYVAIVAAFSGCASHQSDLLQNGYVSLEPTLSGSLSHAPEISERDGEMVVSGRLDSGEITNGGHVDVRVVGPDGATVYEAAIDFRKPRPQSQTGGPKGGYRGPRTNPHATYSVRFPGLPPQGSVVHVKLDAMPHGKAGGQ